ncbi:hypothetical protein diail_749 [Diaporthe ilicicola]|nr:hypothetical protein diail_749 [Diaporthe ilicicola]
MPAIDHDIDAEGDVLFILQNPNEPFAIWDKEEYWELPRPPPPLHESHCTVDYRLYDPELRWDTNTSFQISEGVERQLLKASPMDSVDEFNSREKHEATFRLSSKHFQG